jgi:hypothetical protein
MVQRAGFEPANPYGNGSSWGIIWFLILLARIYANI